MKTINSDNKCRKLRAWLHNMIDSRLGRRAAWIQDHLATCPRCQRRLAAIAKVDLALAALRSQPHSLDLLAKANAQAIAVLRHSLQKAPKANRLRTAVPRPRLLETLSCYRDSAINLAACLLILLLMKLGVFSSMSNFQTEGRKVLNQYYSTQAGQDLADDVFSA